MSSNRDERRRQIEEAMTIDPNYQRPRPSLCDCETDYHDPNCLFFDPYVDDPELRAEDYAEAFTRDGSSQEEWHDIDHDALAADPDLVFDPYYGCFVPRDLDAQLEASHDGTVPVSGMSAEEWANLAKFTGTYKTCRHYMDAFTLPSGTVVYLSGWSHTPLHRPDEMYPDVGVYLDRQWFPADNFAYAVSWTDFGLPTIPDWHVTRSARAAIAHAEQGDVVEIGCLGAHGRTGSFLAIMVMLDDPSYSGKRAIKYVREHHCGHAVETKEQERYVSRIAGALKRGEV